MPNKSKNDAKIYLLTLFFTMIIWLNFFILKFVFDIDIKVVHISFSELLSIVLAIFL